jgi:hypothetical protein
MLQLVINTLRVIGLRFTQSYNAEDLVGFFGFLFRVSGRNKIELSIRTKTTQEEIISTEKKYKVNLLRKV